MKKIIFLILLFLIAVLAIAQPGPPGGLIINHGRPISCDSAVLFDWDDVPGATSYGMQIFAGSSIIVNATGIPVSEYTTPPYTFTPNTYYYLHLNATGPGGTGQWGGFIHFTTGSGAPNPPALISPPDSSVFVSLYPTFDWNDVPGAAMYRIQISTSPVFSLIVLDVNGLVNSGYVITTNILAICTRYYWRVSASNSGGTSQWSQVRTFTTVCPSGVKQLSSEIPTIYKLYNNYPNPFNPSTNIRYQITNSSKTSLVIYNITGKEVVTLVNEKQPPGIYEVAFDGSNLPSGVYFYRLQSGDFADTKKMVMIK